MSISNFFYHEVVSAVMVYSRCPCVARMLGNKSYAPITSQNRTNDMMEAPGLDLSPDRRKTSIIHKLTITSRVLDAMDDKPGHDQITSFTNLKSRLPTVPEPYW